MSFKKALKSISIIFRCSPEQFFPVYFFILAIPVIGRVFVLIGIGLVYLYIASSSRLFELRDRIYTIDLDPPPPEDEEAFEEWAMELVGIFDVVVTLEGILILLIASLFTIGVTFLVYASHVAARLGTCYGRLQSKNGTAGGFEAVRLHWHTMVGLFIIEAAAWIGLSVFAFGLFRVVGSFSGFPGLLAWIYVPLLGIIAWIFIRLVFAFAPVAVIVDQTGIVDSLHQSISFIRTQPVDAASYALFVPTITGLWSVLFVLSAPSGGGLLVLLFGFLLVLPVMDLLKTALYADHRNSILLPPPAESSIFSQIKRGLGRSVSEAVTFVRETPVLHGISIFILLAGFSLGWIISGPFENVLETSIATRITDIHPPSAAIEFMSNNWIVATSTSLGGLMVGIPTIFSLALNGIVFGIYARLEVSQVELIAFVIPHGILEIPAIIIAGSLGLWIGTRAWLSYRNKLEVRHLLGAVERSFWILIALAILLILAGIIEGFISPFYYDIIV